MDASPITTAPTTERLSLAAQLRQQTRAEHQYAESRQLEQAMATGRLPKELFAAQLQQRLLMHQALEYRLRQLPAIEPRAAALIHERQFRSAHIAQDLAHYLPDAPMPQTLAATQAFVDWVNALNWLELIGPHYVFEGSKNGARYLAKMLRAIYRLTPGQGDRYLDPHGDQQPTLWQGFKTDMENLPLNQAEIDAIVAAARQAFRLISDVDDAIWQLRPQS